ncbi:MAG: CBS domain-containing protein [Candidatus Freyarchaeota archaeon]|nr:CBS domain-containing protein [Candidatus Jordarchaeia archaeon]MBS7269016.1 CBS domain-containing protein [Candidatus Jordarchaeia archaeon]MBS7280888.1 CBS domain-containing protein [Candidatus Jordarchaeia archaeon]
MSIAYDIARKNVVICKSDDPLPEVARMMVNEEVGSLLVEDDSGEIVGIVTDREIFRVIAEGENPQDLIAEDVMISPVYKVNRNASIIEVERIFQQTGAERIAVEDGDKIVGIISRKIFDRLMSMKDTGRLLPV